MTTYIAFLRGINIGNRKIRMGDLQKVFESLRFENVKTLIASGNVLFDFLENNEQILVKTIEEALEKKFGFGIPVILRTRDGIEKLVNINPFGSLQQEKGVRLQVTFFKNIIEGVAPIEKNGFTILYIGERELASAVSPSGKTTALMTFIDKTFGKNSTTRNWNTIQKLLER